MEVITMGNFNFFIPNELHKKFKLYSIAKEKDMRVILTEFIDKLVKDYSLEKNKKIMRL